MPEREPGRGRASRGWERAGRLGSGLSILTLQSVTPGRRKGRQGAPFPLPATCCGADTRDRNRHLGGLRRLEREGPAVSGRAGSADRPGLSSWQTRDVADRAQRGHSGSGAKAKSAPSCF